MADIRDLLLVGSSQRCSDVLPVCQATFLGVSVYTRHRWSAELISIFRYNQHGLGIFFFFFKLYGAHRDLHSSPTRRSSDLGVKNTGRPEGGVKPGRNCFSVAET